MCSLGSDGGGSDEVVIDVAHDILVAYQVNDWGCGTSGGIVTR